MSTTGTSRRIKKTGMASWTTATLRSTKATSKMTEGMELANSSLTTTPNPFTKANGNVERNFNLEILD